jgi:DinB superfamily
MSQHTTAAWFPDWPQYAARITDAVRDLGPDGLALRASPDHLPIWGLAAHTAGARLYWLCGVCGEENTAPASMRDMATGYGWEDEPDHPRTAGELVAVLDASWAVVERTLERWTPAMMADVIDRRSMSGAVEHHTRISILNRMFSHDAYHAGEISQLLGVANLPQIDLWAQGPSPTG